MLSYCVYILFSRKDFLLYVDTSDLKARKTKHDTGGVKSTAPRRPLGFIFCEYFLFKSDAKRREDYFKTSIDRKALKLTLAGTLINLGYKGDLKNLKIEFSINDIEND